MPPPVAPIAALRASNLAVDSEATPAAGVAADSANENLVKCIVPFVQVAGMRHRYPSSHETIGPFIVTIVTSRKGPAAPIITGRTGNLYGTNFDRSRLFF